MFKRSIRAEKLLSCDYCPLAYHADCIFELADAVPNVKEKFWMCPCHAEHMIDQKLLKSNRLTERIELWSRFRLKPDNDERSAADSLERIQREFVNKCSSLSAGKRSSSSSLSVFAVRPSHIPDEIVGIYDRTYGRTRHRSNNETTTQADVRNSFSLFYLILFFF